MPSLTRPCPNWRDRRIRIGVLSNPEAFRAAMTANGVADPACCVFVRDRPYDDVYRGKSAGMRAVLIPNSDVPL